MEGFTKRQQELLHRASKHKDAAFTNPEYAKQYSTFCKDYGFIKAGLFRAYVDAFASNSKRLYKMMQKGDGRAVAIQTTMLPPTVQMEKSPIKEWAESFRQQEMGAHE